MADLVDAPFERVGTGAGATMYGYWSDLATDGFEVAYVDRMVAGVIPTNHGESCVFVCVPPKRLGSRRIDALAGSWPRPTRSSRPPSRTPRRQARCATFPGRPGFVRRSWGPGWALVGDAGYWKDPVSTHGISDALRDAELLARAVAGSDGPARAAPGARRLPGDPRPRVAATVRRHRSHRALPVGRQPRSATC